MNDIKRLSKYINPLAILVFTALLGAYFYTAHFFSLNIPLNDDFNDILLFILKTVQAETPAAFLSPFFEQHIDHRHTASRIIYWLVFQLEGTLNFKSLVMVAQAGILLLLGLLYSQIKVREQRLFLLMLAGMCLLHPRAGTLMIWPVAAMELYFVYAYALATLILINRNSTAALLGALLTALLCSFTYIAGLFVLPVGLAFLIYQKCVRISHSWLHVGLWLLGSSMIIFSYQYDYVSGSASTDESVNFIIDNFLYCMQFALVLTGSAFSFDSETAAQIIGISVIMATLFVVIKERKGQLGPLHFFLLFAALVIGVTTAGRGPSTHMAIFGEPLYLSVALNSRYSYSSLIIMTTLLILLVQKVRFEHWKSIVSITAFMLTITIACYVSYLPKMHEQKNYRVQWYHERGFAPLMTDAKRINDQMAIAERLGVYQRPESL